MLQSWAATEAEMRERVRATEERGWQDVLEAKHAISTNQIESSWSGVMLDQIVHAARHRVPVDLSLSCMFDI